MKDPYQGLALDHKNSFLYIADSGAKSIFRYTVLTDVTGVIHGLSVSAIILNAAPLLTYLHRLTLPVRAAAEFVFANNMSEVVQCITYRIVVRELGTKRSIL